jgi:hypothetical protein
LIQYKNFEYVVTEVPLSNIDRNMNKVEWRIQTNVKPGVPFRMWNTFWRHWDTDWVSRSYDDTSGAITIEKRNGKVYGGASTVNAQEQLDCASLPARGLE